MGENVGAAACPFTVKVAVVTVESVWTGDQVRAFKILAPVPMLPAVMVPPVAEYVTFGAAVVPSLHHPVTVNCRVAPGAKVAAAGARMTRVRVGGGTETVTVELSGRSPAAVATMTLNVPVACPAVYSPVEDRVPPVAAQVSGGGAVEPSLHAAATVNC